MSFSTQISMRASHSGEERRATTLGREWVDGCLDVKRIFDTLRVIFLYIKGFQKQLLMKNSTVIVQYSCIKDYFTLRGATDGIYDSNKTIRRLASEIGSCTKIT